MYSEIMEIDYYLRHYFSICSKKITRPTASSHKIYFRNCIFVEFSMNGVLIFLVCILANKRNIDNSICRNQSFQLT